MKWKEILKFLFPEYQIIRSIKKHGFFVNPDKIDQKYTTSYSYSWQNTSWTSYTYSSTTTGGNAPTGSSTWSSGGSTRSSGNAWPFGSGSWTSGSGGWPSGSGAWTSTNQTNTNPFASNTGFEPEMTYANVGPKFELAKSQLMSVIIGQRNFLDRLMIAFKRPFASKPDPVKPKNAILVLGPDSSGRHTCIETAAAVLSMNGLLEDGSVAEVDLSLYPTVSERSLFLSDLYKALVSPAAGIVSIRDYIQDTIFRGISEYVLHNYVPPRTTGRLVLADGEPAIIWGLGRSRDTAVMLREWLPKKPADLLEEVKKELDAVIGLQSVKEYVLGLERNLKIQQMRESAGMKKASVTMHMIFTGNPGTGKTTIARIVAKYLKALGVLSIGQLREVTRSDLVGQYVGHTAKLVQDVVKSALGGVLFIDEAYALCRNKHDSFGLEAIDTLVKAMEDHRDDLVVILAGYRDEMEQFLQMNSGLKSRFPNVIEFPDYTPQEMVQIAIKTADQGEK